MTTDKGKGLPKLPEKYPRKIAEGPSMDYSNSAFPKPQKKPKKGKWGKK